MSSSSDRPPEEPTFCLDEALGRKFVAGALRDAGVSVQLLTDHHPPGTKDPVWLPDICGRGWVILTKDKKMRRHPVELGAMVKYGGRAFVFTGGNVKGPDIGTAFVKAMPRIRRILRERPGPFIASVTLGGEVVLVHPTSRR